MKKGTATIVFLGVFITMMTLQAQEKAEPKKLFVKAYEENLRDSPSGKKIGTVLLGTPVKEIEKSGKWTKVQLECWIYTPSLTTDTGEVEAERNKHPAELVNYKFELSGIDGEEQIYSPHVKWYYQFQNNTSKTIIGIKYKATFKNSFGKTVHSFVEEEELKIAPGKKSSYTWFRYWENNAFATDVYDVLSQGAGEKTLKAEVKILQVVYEDGTKQDLK